MSVFLILNILPASFSALMISYRRIGKREGLRDKNGEGLPGLSEKIATDVFLALCARFYSVDTHPQFYSVKRASLSARCGVFVFLPF